MSGTDQGDGHPTLHIAARQQVRMIPFRCKSDDYEFNCSLCLHAKEAIHRNIKQRKSTMLMKARIHIIILILLLWRLNTLLWWLVTVTEGVSVHNMHMCVCVCGRPPACGMCPNYEVAEFQPRTVTSPEPRLCRLLLHIYTCTAPPTPSRRLVSFQGGHPHNDPTTPPLTFVVTPHRIIRPSGCQLSRSQHTDVTFLAPIL